MKSALRVHFTLEIARVGDCVRTDAVVLKQIIEFQRTLVDLKGWRLLKERACNGHWFGVSMAVVCWQMKEAMSSSSTVVSFLMSVSSSSPPSSGGCSDPMAGGSVHESRQLMW